MLNGSSKLHLIGQVYVLVVTQEVVLFLRLVIVSNQSWIMLLVQLRFLKMVVELGHSGGRVRAR